MKYKLESRLSGEIYQPKTFRWSYPNDKKWRGTKEPIDKVKRGVKKLIFFTQGSENKDHGILSHHFMANRWGNNGNSDRLYFLGLQNHCRWWLQPWNLKTLVLWKKSYDKPRQCVKKQRHHFANKGLYCQSYGFSSSHVQMWELDHKEGRVLKKWSFQTVVLEKILESPLDCKKIKPVNPKGNQPWIFIGKIDAEAEAPYFGHLMRRTDSLEKTLMLGKIEGRRRRGRQRMRWLGGTTDSMDRSLSYWRTGKPAVLQSMGLQRAGHNLATEEQ